MNTSPQRFSLEWVVLGICLTALVAVAWVWWPHWGLGLGAETAPLAWLQCQALTACALCAAMRSALPRLALASGTATTGSRAINGWAVLALLIFLASLDERFMFHEQIQEQLTFTLIDRFHMPDELALRRVQALTGVYALAGLVGLWWLLAQATAPAWRWMRTGIVIGMVAIGMDVATDDMQWQILEEALEFLAETCMLCGLLNEVRTRVTPPN